MLLRSSMTLVLTGFLLLMASGERPQADRPDHTSNPETVAQEETNSTGIPGVDGRYIVQPDDAVGFDFWGAIEGNNQEDDLVLLRRERLEAAQDAMKAIQTRLELGTAGEAGELSAYSGLIHQASRLVLEARLEAAENDAELLAAWEEYLPHARNQEWLIQKRNEQGLYGGGSLNAATARATRMEAEIHVLKLRRDVYGKK